MNFLLEKEFKKCLERFPELKDVDLMVEDCEELAGAEGQLGSRRVVILFVPEGFKDKPEYLVPIIYHELSHLLNGDVDKNFEERADEKSKELWRNLNEAGILRCETKRF